MYAELLLSLLLLHACALPANASPGKATVEDHVRLEGHFRDVRSDWQDMDSILPRLNDEKPVNITLKLMPLNFDVDIDKDKLYVNTWVEEKWNDNRMAWDPKDYGGITLELPSVFTLWRSDLTLLNSYGPRSMNQVPTESRVMLYHDGTILDYHHLGLESWCSFDRENDDAVHTCKLKFGSWAYDATFIDYLPDIDHFDLSMYSVDPHWTIINTKAKRSLKYYPGFKTPYPEVHFIMKFRKRVPGDHFDLNNKFIPNRQG